MVFGLRKEQDIELSCSFVYAIQKGRNDIMREEIIKRAEEIIRENTAEHAQGEPYCVLALIDENGYPTASTITPAKAEGIRKIDFLTGTQSNKAKRILACSRASVCFNTGGKYNITLVGRIKVVEDLAVKQALWYAGMANHFSGPEDPACCALCFETERYNLFVDWKDAEGTL